MYGFFGCCFFVGTCTDQSLENECEIKKKSMTFLAKRCLLMAALCTVLLTWGNSWHADLIAGDTSLPTLHFHLLLRGGGGNIKHEHGACLVLATVCVCLCVCTLLLFVSIFFVVFLYFQVTLDDVLFFRSVL